MKYADHLRDWMFKRVHGHHLIYNTCWEDPRCDRELLEFDSDSRIAMITSAGCNALDYLLDDPAEVHCVDMNPRQNALLELKRASFRQLPFQDHWKMFGTGRHERFNILYNEQLRTDLPAYAQAFWDRNGHYFNGRGVRKSFYHFGTSGALAWMLVRFFKARPKLYRELARLFNCDTLEEQQALYHQLEPRLVGQVVQWAVNRHLTMCLIGVPQSQQALFRAKYKDGAAGFLKECLRRVFTLHLVKDNYFWRLYFYGKYEQECCPEYLREDNFTTLNARQERIRQYNQTLAGFLQENPRSYSHFILLDHQDWLAANDEAALIEEWQQILMNSKKGTKILLRSASHVVDFFPDFVREAVDFVQEEQLAESHLADRVGTYPSVYLGIVR